MFIAVSSFVLVSAIKRAPRPAATLKLKPAVRKSKTAAASLPKKLKPQRAVKSQRAVKPRRALKPQPAAKARAQKTPDTMRSAAEVNAEPSTSTEVGTDPTPEATRPDVAPPESVAVAPEAAGMAGRRLRAAKPKCGDSDGQPSKLSSWRFVTA